MLLTSAFFGTLSTLAAGCDVSEERIVQVSTSPGYGYGSSSSSSSGSHESWDADYISTDDLLGVVPTSSAVVLMDLDANGQPRSLDARFANWNDACTAVVPSSGTIARLSVDAIHGVGTYALDNDKARFVVARNITAANDAGVSDASTSDAGAAACTWTASPGQVLEGSLKLTFIDRTRVEGTVTVSYAGGTRRFEFGQRRCTYLLGSSRALTCGGT